MFLKIISYFSTYKDYAYVGFYKLRQPAILVRDLELIKRVFVSDFSSFHDNDVVADPEVDPLFAKNPFCETGSKWKAVRNQITPCFTSGKVKIL